MTLKQYYDCWYRVSGVIFVCDFVAVGVKNSVQGSLVPPLPHFSNCFYFWWGVSWNLP